MPISSNKSTIKAKKLSRQATDEAIANVIAERKLFPLESRLKVITRLGYIDQITEDQVRYKEGKDKLDTDQSGKQILNGQERDEFCKWLEHMAAIYKPNKYSNR